MGAPHEVRTSPGLSGLLNFFPNFDYPLQEFSRQRTRCNQKSEEDRALAAQRAREYRRKLTPEKRLRYKEGTRLRMQALRARKRSMQFMEQNLSE